MKKLIAIASLAIVLATSTMALAGTPYQDRQIREQHETDRLSHEFTHLMEDLIDTFGTIQD